MKTFSLQGFASSFALIIYLPIVARSQFIYDGFSCAPFTRSVSVFTNSLANYTGYPSVLDQALTNTVGFETRTAMLHAEITSTSITGSIYAGVYLLNNSGTTNNLTAFTGQSICGAEFRVAQDTPFRFTAHAVAPYADIFGSCCFGDNQYSIAELNGSSCGGYNSYPWRPYFCLPGNPPTAFNTVDATGTFLAGQGYELFCQLTGRSGAMNLPPGGWIQASMTIDFALIVYPQLVVKSPTNFPPTSLALQWPAAFTNYSVVAATNLTPPIQWQPVTNQAQVVDDTFQVIIDCQGASRFFRLEQSP